MCGRIFGARKGLLLTRVPTALWLIISLLREKEFQPPPCATVHHDIVDTMCFLKSTLQTVAFLGSFDPDEISTLTRTVVHKLIPDAPHLLSLCIRVEHFLTAHTSFSTSCFHSIRVPEKTFHSIRST